MSWRVCQPAQTQISPQTTGGCGVNTALGWSSTHLLYCHQHSQTEMPAFGQSTTVLPVLAGKGGLWGPTSTVNHKQQYTHSPPHLHRYFTFMVNTDRTEVKCPWQAFSEDLQNQRISVLLSLLSPPILVLSLHSGLFILRVSFHLLTCRSSFILRGTWRRASSPGAISVI